MPAQKPTAREFAAIAYALGRVRGELYSCQFAEINPKSIARILRATSLENIARAIGLCESDLAVDWSEVLTEQELEALRGGE